eukprot:CAMPEP_0202427504 /NCGR_PEP_ID=MMETSP1345-20130828/1709_1 /ASSEMBLY_ACC=CAM_ASM_000843 /TAXON_ID=342563 /ORGANISM="Fabrea Fabrea salina" /LENGTH=137 /DNA_ID=CAMNT_0049038233 /DNA_START=1 /DNA_END=411 /DNA_ORIENTATION=-
MANKMFSRVVRNFAKIRVPQGFSGELKLYKGNWQLVSKGEPIALIGNQTLRAESSGLIVSQLSQEGSPATEGTQIYRFFDFMSWAKMLLYISSPLVTLYLVQTELELRHPRSTFRKIRKTLTQPKPAPEVEGPLIEN